jgi:hypothetical protein
MLGVSLAWVLGIAASLLVCAPVAAQTPVASTKVVKYSANSMTAAKIVKGSCWTSSIASPRADAFRCTAGNEIYDPCFKIDPTSVGCPTDVASDSGVVFDLTKPLPPAQSPPPAPQAWAFVLQSGEKCNRATGTVVADFTYYCSGESGVCQGPDLGKTQAAYFVKCGTPKDALHVTGVTSSLVKTVYE